MMIIISTDDVKTDNEIPKSKLRKELIDLLLQKGYKKSNVSVHIDIE